MADYLSKYAVSLVGFLCALVPFLLPFLESTGVVTVFTTGSSTSSNQDDAGSIIVRHIKSISVPSFPLRVYGPMWSTHNTSQGFVMTSLVGTCPYLLECLLLIWQDRQVLTYCRTVYAYQSSTSQLSRSLRALYVQGAEDGDDTMQQRSSGEILGQQACHLAEQFSSFN
jgi:hypothetical protein